jgi:outer membrane lipoprotein-sorting protein
MNAILISFLIMTGGFDEAHQVLDHALSRYGDVRTIQATITSIETSSFDTAAQLVGYEFFFKAPNLVRYDFFEPDTGIMLLDGKRLWLYQPGDTAAYFSAAPTDTSRIQTPLSSFKIVDSLLSLGFEFSNVTRTGDTLMSIRLEPPSFAGIDMKITLDVDLRDTLLRRIAIEGADFSQKTEYLDYVEADGGIKLPSKIVVTKKSYGATLKRVTSFKKIDVNSTIPDTVFEFVPPEGVKIHILGGN